MLPLVGPGEMHLCIQLDTPPLSSDIKHLHGKSFLDLSLGLRATAWISDIPSRITKNVNIQTSGHTLPPVYFTQWLISSQWRN